MAANKDKIYRNVSRPTSPATCTATCSTLASFEDEVMSMGSLGSSSVTSHGALPASPVTSHEEGLTEVRSPKHKRQGTFLRNFYNPQSGSAKKDTETNQVLLPVVVAPPPQISSVASSSTQNTVEEAHTTGGRLPAAPADPRPSGLPHRGWVPPWRRPDGAAVQKARSDEGPRPNSVSRAGTRLRQALTFSTDGASRSTRSTGCGSVEPGSPEKDVEGTLSTTSAAPEGPEPPRPIIDSVQRTPTTPEGSGTSPERRPATQGGAGRTMEMFIAAEAGAHVVAHLACRGGLAVGRATGVAMVAALEALAG